MAVSSRRRNKPPLTLQDYIATQGILVVAVALVFVVLQCLAPEYARDILSGWQRLEETVPTVQQLWLMIASCFV